MSDFDDGGGHNHQGMLQAGRGMWAVLCVVGGGMQYYKYAFVGGFVQMLPAIYSNSTSSLPNGTGLMFAILVDLLQKVMWSGVRVRDGINFKEFMALIVVVILLGGEVLAIWMQFVVPNVAGIALNSLPAVALSRFFDSGNSGVDWGIIMGSAMTLSAGAIVFCFAWAPEFLMAQQAKSGGEKSSWFLLIVGMAFGHLVNVVMSNGQIPLIPSFRLFG